MDEFVNYFYGMEINIWYIIVAVAIFALILVINIFNKKKENIITPKPIPPKPIKPSGPIKDKGGKK